ncbi:MAG TPA: DUF6391 domain-containing protein [Anaerolineae bacterium]|nr:DUF6391 domain-containing protein [Anaerolineae bacterium]
MAVRLLKSPLITRIRQNHALEHATMHVLGRSNPSLSMVGHSDWNGFSLYGAVDSQTLRGAVGEALDRLLANESHLAIHPHCGTNLAVVALLTGGASYVVGRSSGRSMLRRLVTLVAVTMAACFVARPLGLVLQRYVTTTGSLEGVHVETIRREVNGPLVVHRVSVRRDSEA